MARTLDFFAWFPADYRADTRHLTREEHFAYREIIDEIFLTDQERCRIKDDDEYLRELCRASADEWSDIRKTLIDGPRALLTKRGGWLYSSRLTKEIEKARVKSQKNREAAEKRWQSERNADAMQTQSERNASGIAIRREENREEENQKKKNPSDSKKKNSKALAEEFVVDDRMREFAAARGVDADECHAEWIDHLRANGYRVGKNPLSDPAAALRRWVTQAAKQPAWKRTDKPRAATPTLFENHPGSKLPDLPKRRLG
jgi:uncharacterized protein YdaU (DUF1376 family)